MEGTLNGSRRIGDGSDISWEQAVHSTSYITVFSFIWGAVTAVLSLMFSWWLTPVLAGLVFSAPIIVFSSQKRAGDFIRRCGIFLTPSEVNTDNVLLMVREKLLKKTDTCENVSEHPLQPDLLPEIATEMPAQKIYKKSRYSSEQLPVKA